MATRADIKTAILGLLPDNILQDISPLDERDSFDLVIDNFLNIDDNAITNGLTLDGVSGDIKIGGALVENTVIDGNSFSYLLNLSDLSGFNFNTANTSGFNGRALGFNISNGADLNITSVGTGLTNANVAGLLDINPGNAGFSVFPDITVSANFYGFGISSGGGGLTVFDSVDFKGLKRNAGDGASLVWATDNDYYPTIADVKANVSGGGVSITDNYIPIGNATNDGIEDSKLRQTFQTTIGKDENFLIFEDFGVEDDKVFKIQGSGLNTTDKLIFDATYNPSNSTTAIENWQTSMLSNGVGVRTARGVAGFGTQDQDYIRLDADAGGVAQLINLFAQDRNLTQTHFHISGEVTYAGHKFGTGTDPRPLSATADYTWWSDNTQRFVIGGFSSGGGTANAHLVINSLNGSPNTRPHLRFIGDYDAAANGAASNNSMYLDAIDSKLHLIGSAGQNIILEDLGPAITDNYIPIGNATNDGIEDSNLLQTRTGTTSSLLYNESSIVDDTTYTQILGGDQSGTTDENTLTWTYRNGVSESQPAHLDGTTGKKNWRTVLKAHEAEIQLFSNYPESSQRQTGFNLNLEGSNVVSITGWTTTSQIPYPRIRFASNYRFEAGGGVNPSYNSIIAEKDSSEVYIGNIRNSVIISGFGNSYLNVINDVGGEDKPHIKLVNGYDEGLGVQNGNIWLSSNDSKVYLRNNNSVNIPLEGIKSVISNSQASTATLTPDANSEDIEIVTALAGALTIASPTGTPVEGQKLVIKIKDDGTSRALTWNAIFQVIGTTLPTATTISKWHRIECEYNVTDTKWDVIDVKEQV